MSFLNASSCMALTPGPGALTHCEVPISFSSHSNKIRAHRFQHVYRHRVILQKRRDYASEVVVEQMILVAQREDLGCEKC